MKSLYRFLEVAKKFDKYNGWHISVDVHVHGHNQFGSIGYHLAIMEPGQNYDDDTVTFHSVGVDDDTLEKWATYLECKLEYIERMAV